MTFRFDSRFKRQYKKLPIKLRKRFDERLKLFAKEPTNPLLRLHPLKGRYGGYYSINVSGDLRALFYREGEDIVIFSLIGTHSQLYG